VEDLKENLRLGSLHFVSDNIDDCDYIDVSKIVLKLSLAEI
jgi:hypothetical protein